jgi:hypothetical protein
MPQVKKGNLQHIHIHIHTEKSKPKPKSKPKSKNLRDKSNFRNRRGKKGLSHQDIGSHIPFNAVSNPLAVQLNTLENMRLQLLPSAGHDIGEYFGARSAFGLSHPIQEQINRIDNQTKNINSRMDDSVKIFTQFKNKVKNYFDEIEQADLPEVKFLDEKSPELLQKEEAINNQVEKIDKLKTTQEQAEATINLIQQIEPTKPVPKPKPAPAQTPAPAPEAEPDSDSDDESIVADPTFSDAEISKIKHNTLSTISQKIWIIIFNELGYAIPLKPTDSKHKQDLQSKYKRVLRIEFEKRNGIKKHLIDYDVIKKLI